MSFAEHSEPILYALRRSVWSDIHPGVGTIPVLVAFSGGVDSAVLLHALCELREEFGIMPIAAYYDHAIRPADERARERSCVARTSSELGVELHTERAETGEIAAQAGMRGKSVEAVAREYRYAFFHRLWRDRIGTIAPERKRGKTGTEAGTVALAHHRDDQVEGVLLRLLQGSGLRGLAGMRSVTRFAEPGTERMVMWRPFLTVDREEILRFAASRRVSWVEDSSNASDSYLRNRVRHTVIPPLRSAVPDGISGIASAAAKLVRADESLEKAANAACPWAVDEGAAEVSWESFIRCDEELRCRVLYRGVRALGMTPEHIPSRFFRPLLHATAAENPQLRLRGYGVRFEVLRERLRVSRDVAASRTAGYAILQEMDGLTDGSRVRMICRYSAAGGADTAAATVELGRVNLPCVVREPRIGDKVSMAAGPMPVGSLLADAVVPRDERGAVPIIEDRRGIVAVVLSPWGASDLHRSPDTEPVSGAGPAWTELSIDLSVLVTRGASRYGGSEVGEEPFA